MLRKFDHAGDFSADRGRSYTPFLLVTLRGPWGWVLFGVVWGLAIVGIALKFWFAGRFRVASTLIYIAMGWLFVLTVLHPLLLVLPREGILAAAGRRSFATPAARPSTCGNYACLITTPSGTSG